MILGKRILSAIHLVVLAGLVGVSATTAQTISVTDASAAPALVAPGDRVTIAVSLTNSDPTRAWAAGGRVDAIITFTHTVTGTSFPLSGTAVTSADIDGGGGNGTAIFSGTVPTPTTDSGSYRYSITISNPTGGATLDTETISAVTTALTVAANGKLSVTGATAAPASVAPGDEVTIAVSLTNSHPTTAWAAGGTVDAIITFTHTVTGTSFPLSGTAVTSADIDGDGGTGTATFSGTVPTQTTESGNYRYSIEISNPTGGATFPGLASLNSTSSSTPALTIVGQPDLKIISLTYPAGISYVGGDTIPMSLTYENSINSDGTNNVPYVPGSIHAANFRIEVVLSSNPTFGDTDDFLLTADVVGARIDANGTPRALNWTQLLPGNFTGSYYVLAKIDTLEAVAEATEDSFTDNGNNIWYDVNGSRIALDPSNFPTIFWGSNEGDNWSDQPTNNEDGRYTVYASDATNLVTGDGNAKRDVFIYDQQTQTIRRLSVSQQGTEGNGASQSPFISSDSTSVAFSSEATNLILGDTNGFSDIYVVKSFTGEISRVNVRDDGTQANGSSFRPALSQDGQFVVFESTATNLIAGGTTTGVTHIYRRDHTAGTIALVSVDSGGGNQGNGNSTQARVSADGRYVVFASDATNLVAGDTNATRDIFLRDMTNDTTVRVSVSSGGTEGNGASRSPTISADGAHVAFHSLASNLVAGDTNGVSDVFSHTVAASTTVRVSVSTAGTEATDPSGGGFELGSINPSISSTGRFVAFSSMANNLTDGDALGQYQATDANGALDVFVRDRDVSESGTFDTPGNVVTVMVSRNRFGFQTARLLGIPSTAASDIFPAISADGRWVTFPSDAENTAGLVHGANNRTSPDLNTFRDVFVHDRRINALPNPSNDPTVSLTAPVDGSSIFIGSTLTVVGSATAPAGTVASVEFYVNGLSLGQITTAPYTVDWTPTVAGSYTLSALVVDSFGNQGVSTNVTVSVTTISPAPPVVSLASPVNGATVTVNSLITLRATASDPDGTVASVEFFANGLSLGLSTTFPYSMDWNPTSLGTVSLTAEATDVGGNSATSTAVAVTITGGSAPVSTLTSPVVGSSFVVGNPISIAATASASSPATVSVVRFLANGVLITEDSASPYNGTWTPTSSGSYSLVAEVKDTIGNVTLSAPRTVLITDNAAPSVSLTNPGGNQSIQLGAGLLLVASASDPDGSVTNVQFRANGITLGSDTTVPYSFSWLPTSAGSYTVTAVATDNVGNVVSSAGRTVTVQSAAAPTVALTGPLNGQTFLVGSPVQVSASATAAAGVIARVEFLVNGASLIGPNNPDLVAPFVTTWIPTAAGNYTFAAVATDTAGQSTISSQVTVTVQPNAAPAVSMVSPTSGTALTAGTPITLIGSATDTDGTVTSVSFLANGLLVGTSTQPPYSFAWTPGAAGTYVLEARAVDNSGNVTGSTAVNVTVVSNGAPTVAITSPSQGKSVQLGSATTLRAVATDSGGNITSVTFYANGVALGSDATAPYEVSFNPPANGVYRLVATATDNGGQLSSSAEVFVAVVNPSEDDTETIYTGSYVAGSETGTFTIARKAAISATFVARSDSNPAKIYYYDGISVDAGGNFTLVSDGTTDISGTFGPAGLSGKFDHDRAIMIGVISLPVSSYTGPVGVIHGSLSAQSDSAFVAIVAPDGRLTFHVRSDSRADVGYGTFNSDGQFSATMVGGGQMSGRVDSATGFLTGSATGGSVSGSLIGAVSSATPASDGFLRNLSTRGFVGSGDQILVAGFVVNGVAPKRVLVRAIGPALANFGVPGVVTDPTLKLYRGSVVEGSNDDWGTDPAVPAASSTVGAFALPAGSTDAALVATLVPGPYTAQVTGVNGATGVGLVEIYDVDSQLAFSPEKMLNVSTRGRVGPEELIAGVIINGVTPKRVLIRAVGPTLSNFGVSGVLADPVLRLVNQETGAVVRENNDWQMGNDALTVSKAAARVGAFALPPGSKDAVLLITLPPGRYTALVSSSAGTSGIAIVEVYEIP